MASKYFNEICPVCEKQFAEEGDDIVVCPDCGTPYHRECYCSKGECVYKEKHKDGFVWKSRTSEIVDQLKEHEQAMLEREEKQETIPPPSAKQDFKAWAALEQKRIQEAYEEQKRQQAEIEGITIDEFAAFIGKNVLYYIPLFQRFSKNKSRVSFNLTAGLLCPLQQLYRKMNLFGLLISVIPILSYIPLILYGTGTENSALVNFFGGNVQQASAFVSLSGYAVFALMLVIMLFNDYFYMRWCIKRINKIKARFEASSANHIEYMTALYNAGCPSLLNTLLLGGSLSVFYSILFMLLGRLV